MALIKHVDGVDIEMKPMEEGDFLDAVPARTSFPPPFLLRPDAPEPTKAELKAQLDDLAAKIEKLK
jgi:hypothetical protein